MYRNIEALRLLVVLLMHMSGKTQNTIADEIQQIYIDERPNLAGQFGFGQGDINKVASWKPKDIRDFVRAKEAGGGRSPRASLFALWALRQSQDLQPIPLHLRSMYSAAFPEQQITGLFPREDPVPQTGLRIVEDPVVLTRNSGYGEIDNRLRYASDGLQRLLGLHLLVRPSTETLEHDGKLERGVSISLLNLIPEYVQAGAHHPLFRLHQKGATHGTSDVEGVVLAQDDRLVLSGRDTGQKRNLMISIYHSREATEYYKNPGSNGRRRSLGGVMLGLSNARSHTASLFRLFAIPNSLLSEDQLTNPDEQPRRDEFAQLYSHAREDVIGVFPRALLLEKLGLVGVSDPRDEIGAMLEQAKKQLIFSIS